MFGGFVERVMGPVAYIIVYFAALLGGNAWALLENKTKPNYRALGASGATSGIVIELHPVPTIRAANDFPHPLLHARCRARRGLRDWQCHSVPTRE